MTKSLTLISSAEVVDWPVHDDGTPLVDGAQHPAIFVATKRYAANPWHRLVRVAVRKRLEVAARHLPDTARLCLEEGYRPLAVQRHLFYEYLNELRATFGHLQEQELIDHATQYVARPDGAPPHVTGGAVDITLLSPDGTELDMGSTSDDTPLDNGSRNFTFSPDISAIARERRALLSNAMELAGFVNYPAEWWHWSYGDRYWALCRQHAFAIYGAVTPPPLDSDTTALLRRPRPV